MAYSPISNLSISSSSSLESLDDVVESLSLPLVVVLLLSESDVVVVSLPVVLPRELVVVLPSVVLPRSLLVVLEWLDELAVLLSSVVLLSSDVVESELPVVTL